MPRTSTARQRLIESASQLLHARSYAAASVDDVCVAAGVQKGTFYHFFTTKRDLALAALDAQWARAEASILAPAFRPDVPPLARLARFFRLVAEHQHADIVRGCPFGNLAVELSTQDEVIRQRVQAIFDAYRAYFVSALAEAAAAGQVPAESVAVSADAMIAYFQGALLLAKLRNDAGVIDALSGRLPDLLRAHPAVSMQRSGLV